MSKYNPPLVVQKTRTRKLGGSSAVTATNDILVGDIAKQSSADLQWLLQQITIEESEQQEKIGNNPSALYVDNRDTKPLKEAFYRTEVLFGSELQRRAIAAIEIELRKFINRETTPETGQLEAVPITWMWFYVDKPKGTAVRRDPSTIKQMTLGQALIIAPGVPYASMVNRFAAKQSGMGFMGRAAKRLRSMRDFKSWNVRAFYSRRSPLVHPQERWSHGTPCIAISPKSNKSARRRVRR